MSVSKAPSDCKYSHTIADDAYILDRDGDLMHRPMHVEKAIFRSRTISWLQRRFQYLGLVSGCGWRLYPLWTALSPSSTQRLHHAIGYYISCPSYSSDIAANGNQRTPQQYTTLYVLAVDELGDVTATGWDNNYPTKSWSTKLSCLHQSRKIPTVYLPW